MKRWWWDRGAITAAWSALGISALAVLVGLWNRNVGLFTWLVVAWCLFSLKVVYVFQRRRERLRQETFRD